MILPTMTYKEMYDHLAADKKKVDIKRLSFAESDQVLQKNDEVSDMGTLRLYDPFDQ